MTTVLVDESARTSVIATTEAAGAVLVQESVGGGVLIQDAETSVVLITPAAEPDTIVQEVSAGLLVFEEAPPIILVSETLPGGGGVAAATEVLPDRTERGSGTANKNYIFVGFSSAAIGSENEAAAEWRIYRFDIITGDVVYAGGTTAFDKIWVDRESLTYP